MTTNNIRYEVTAQKSPDSTEEIVLPIPKTLLDELGWKEDDEIRFDIDVEGRYILRRSI